MHKGANGLRIKGRTALALDQRYSLFVVAMAGSIPSGHGQQSRQPRDIFSLEAIRITSAIKSFVVLANDRSDVVQGVLKSDHLLA